MREPGGVLLVGVGLDEAALAAAIAALYPQASSLTVLAAPAQQHHAAAADEVWVYGPLGLRGALALVRRIAWRRFEAVYQPQPGRLPHLRRFVRPRPAWHLSLPVSAAHEVGG